MCSHPAQYNDRELLLVLFQAGMEVDWVADWVKKEAWGYCRLVVEDHY
jgi:hypothetical protein